MKFLLNILVWGIAIAIASYVVPWVMVDSLWTAIVVAVVLSLVNATVGLLLRLISMPINFLTLGIVWFIITVLMIQLTDGLVTGFDVNNFWSGAIFALILWLIQGLFWLSEDK
jgi:putative membrane protein